MKRLLLFIIFVCLSTATLYCQNNNPRNKQQAKSAPEWIQNGIIYQIWLRSFTVEGTLSAAAKKLPEVAELGATIIYLSPVMLQDTGTNREFWSPRQQASPANNPRNPYRIMDYTKVDPEYGTEEDLKGFIKTAHYLGLKVLMDLVYYHTGPNNVLMRDPNNYQRDSEGNFIKNRWNFYNLNFENINLREFLLKNMEDWIRKYDFDGWRCDVSSGIPLDFWEEARARMENIKPEVSMLAESNKSEELIKAFDFAYNFNWFYAARDVFAYGDTAAKLRKTWETINSEYPEGSLIMRWVDTHDQYRTEIVFSRKGSKALNVINFMIDGVPYIFNGQEIGDASPYGIHYYPEKSQNEKGAINWKIRGIPDRRDLRNWYMELIALRKSEVALKNGKTVWLNSNQQESVVSFLRKNDTETILTIVNVSNRKLDVEVDYQQKDNDTFVGIFTDSEAKDINVNENNLSVSLGSFGYFVGKLKR